jgi:hypothetical protein
VSPPVIKTTELLLIFQSSHCSTLPAEHGQSKTLAALQSPQSSSMPGVVEHVGAPGASGKDFVS